MDMRAPISIVNHVGGVCARFSPRHVHTRRPQHHHHLLLPDPFLHRPSRCSRTHVSLSLSLSTATSNAPFSHPTGAYAIQSHASKKFHHAAFSAPVPRPHRSPSSPSLASCSSSPLPSRTNGCCVLRSPIPHFLSAVLLHLPSLQSAFVGQNTLIPIVVFTLSISLFLRPGRHFPRRWRALPFLPISLIAFLSI